MHHQDFSDSDDILLQPISNEEEDAETYNLLLNEEQQAFIPIYQNDLTIAWKYLNDDELSDAEYYFKEAIKKDSRCHEAYYGLGSIYYRYLKYWDAIEYMGAAIACHSDYIEAYLICSAAYLGLRNNEKAIEYCNIAIQKNPHHAMAHKTLADIYFQQEEYGLSLEACNNAIQLHSKNSIFYSDRAAIYLKLENITHALLDYKKALTLNPHCKITIRRLKHFLANLDDHSSIEKEILFKVIKKLPEEDQLNWLNQCCDRDTIIGHIMYKPRSAFAPIVRLFGGNPEDYNFIKCNTHKGMLKKIREEIEKINESRHYCDDGDDSVELRSFII